MKSLVILVLVKLSSVTAQDLFTLLPGESTQGIGECEKMEDIDSCTKIDIDFDLLKAEEDFEFDGVTFKHSYTNGDEGSIQTYSYETDNYGSAVILYSEANGHSEVDGDFIFEGSVYRIDGCGEDCHLLVKLGWDTLNSNPDGEMLAPVVEDHEFDQGVPSDRVDDATIYVSRAKFHVCDRSAITIVMLLRSLPIEPWRDHRQRQSPLWFTTPLNLSKSLITRRQSSILTLPKPMTHSSNQALVMFSFSCSALK